MRLERASLVNFRSIESLEFTFNPACQILVGINEAGKTNILRALALLSPDQELSAKDVREGLPSEDPVEESYVRFEFSLEEQDTKRIGALLQENTPADVLKAPVAVDRAGKGLGLLDLALRLPLPGYWADVMALEKGAEPRSLPTGHGYKVAPGWAVARSGAGQNITVKVGAQATKPLAQVLCLRPTEHAPQIPAEQLVEASLDEVTKRLSRFLVSYVEANLPVAVFWQYRESAILPPRVNLQEFASDPSICLPLRNMFELAGVAEIATELAARQERSFQSLKNFLATVAQRSTRHLHSAWPDYTSVEFELVPNGEFIEIGVKDKHNSYELDRRSDGFKRFTSFLLLISARVRAQKLTNSLILFDEPDVSLHPSGARCLRDELIRISKANAVVFSTHSIFMIDNKSVERHLIVQKVGEKTTTRRASESNYSDDEVLHEAVGFSMFEALKPLNVLFEGWKDKRVFELALKRWPDACDGHLLQVGLVHARGVKELGHIGAILELARRRYVVLSDSDLPAQQAKAAFEDLRRDCAWVMYGAAVPGAVTLEDFLVEQSLLAAVGKVVKATTSLAGFAQQESLPRWNRLEAIRAALYRTGVGKAEAKTIVDRIKEVAIEELTSDNLEAEYQSVLSALATRLGFRRRSRSPSRNAPRHREGR